MKKVYLLVVLCIMGFAGFAQTPVYRTSTVYGGSSSFQDSLWTFKSTDYSVVKRLGPTVTGHTITGINSITTDPTTGIHYAILKESSVAGRVLATIDIKTGVCTEIGNLGDKFATLAFNANGTLFGVTGNGATVPETMYWIDKATATKTLFRPLGAGADGEIISYCPDNNKMYHWSGNGTVLWERMDTTGTDVIESLTYTGTPGGETFGAIYIGGGQFLVSNIASHFKIWDTSGVIGSDLSNNPDDIRGIVRESYTTSITPSAVPVICAGNSVTFTVSSGTSGYQWYMDGAPISGETNATYVATVTGVYNCVYADSNSVVDSTPTGINLIVNPLPAAITGINTICIGSANTLADATSGGTWSSSTPAIADAGSITGSVTGVSLGSATISYILSSTGCYVTIDVTVNPLPVVSGGANVTICNGTSTGLTATGGTSYSWSPAAGLSSTVGASVTASPSVTTTYTVTGTDPTILVYSEAFTAGSAPTTQCSAWDAYRATLLGGYNYTGFTIKGSLDPVGISCTDPVIAAGIANALRTGTYYTATSDGQTWTVSVGCGSGCGGGVVEFNNTSSGCNCDNGYNIRPNIGNDNWGGINGPTCHAVSQTMTVEFHVAGCSNTATVMVSVNPLPAVYNVTGGGSYCAGGAGVVVGLDSSNGGFRYQLYNGIATTGSPMAGINAPISFGAQTAAGVYTVIATDTTSGCTNAMNGSATVVIIPVVIPTVSISKSIADTVCSGTHGNFTANPTDEGSAPHYIWKVNGATVGTDSVAYGYTLTDTDMISVTLISSHVCAIPDTVSDTVSVIVFPNGMPLIHLSVTANDTVCAGTTVMITGTPTYGGYNPTYGIILDSVLVSSTNSYSYVPHDGDNLYALMVSNYMCRTSTVAFSNVINMTVEEPIVPILTITGRPGMIVGIGMPDTLTATVSPAGSYNYQWLLNGGIVPGATSNTFIRSSFTNNDSVSCTVIRNDACALSTINSVILKVANVGVKTLATNGKLSLVPNPNKGNFTISGALGTVADEEVTMTVTNMLGQNVYTNKFIAHSGNVDAQVQMANDIASGMYILNLQASNGNNVFHFVVAQ